jgi:MFS family permease
MFGAIGGSAGALGLLLGGVFTSYVSWRWCMFVNVGFGMLALLGALQLMTNSANPDKPRLDLVGTVLATAGLFGIVFGGAKAETNGWGATITIVSLALGVGLLLVFLLSQRRGSYPLMPLHVIADRTRGRTSLCSQSFCSSPTTSKACCTTRRSRPVWRSCRLR